MVLEWRWRSQSPHSRLLTIWPLAHNLRLSFLTYKVGRILSVSKIDLLIWCLPSTSPCVSCSVTSNSLWLHELYVAHLAPLSMEFSRQGSWSGLPFPSPEDLPDPGIKPRSPALQADSLPSEPPGKPVLQQRTSTNISTSFINPYLSKYLFDFSHYLPHLSTNHFLCELQSSHLWFHNRTRQ